MILDLIKKGSLNIIFLIGTVLMLIITKLFLKKIEKEIQ